jgi:hypothetical protein
MQLPHFEISIFLAITGTEFFLYIGFFFFWLKLYELSKKVFAFSEGLSKLLYYGIIGSERPIQICSRNTLDNLDLSDN